MVGSSRVPAGATRLHSMRPNQNTKPPLGRAHSAAPSLYNSRSQSGLISPTDGTTLAAPSRARSPTQGGTKRKERDFDADAGEETNIHVVVRCRGRNDREVRENSGVIVATEGARGKSVELSMGPSALSNKTYNFDKVFSPAADQAIIFEDVVAPILDEMLRGYNCTIFAYGQTGTGKTYTMSGDMSETLGLLSDSAGIIPRALSALFRKLEADDAESFVKCSFIELYNEELKDLLSTDENAKLKIFEDGQKKGHSATIVQGMEESHIKTAAEGIKLLQDGSHKRQVAATKCNDLSSRSHTVFTVTVCIKRTTVTGEDFISAGKLNLVDLAGSENIQRSGAENKRAAEAGLINKSLLTLGRVINALVDRGSHIPYRESKLTRLLQDSLGGRTKTCIIATVSPAKSNLEETISTLDYAFRAKNIRNKPQINQMIEKKTLLKEFTVEIEKLKHELIAARQRNGVYLTNENYEEITGESESRRILSEEQRSKIETMEANLRNKVQELFALTNKFAMLKKDNEITKQALGETSGVLEKTEIVLSDTRQNLADETLLRKAHQATEEDLSEKGGELISTLSRTVKDVDGLHAKLRRKSDMQSVNRTKWSASQNHVTDVTQLVETRIEEFQVAQRLIVDDVSARLQSFVYEELLVMEARRACIEKATADVRQSEIEVATQASAGRDEMNEILEEIKVLREVVKERVGTGLQGLSAAAGRISGEVIGELGRFHSRLHNSYSSLGREFKNIFDDLIKHLNEQKAEAEELRGQLSAATAAAIKSDESICVRIDTCLAEERQQAAHDRETLLSQITDLVNVNGAVQEGRLAGKMNVMRAEMASARTDLEAAKDKYSASMDAWSRKESLLVDEVHQSRETMKSKLKKDWTTVNEHDTSIQGATRSVHEETVRIVDAQMKDMVVQMQALDEFVTRARSHNEDHHTSHLQSLGRLATTANTSYKTGDEELTSAKIRVRSLEADLSARNSALASGLRALDNAVRIPLVELRGSVLAAPLAEYQATGETPQKVQYSYPTSLPRTDRHEQLLDRGRPTAARALSDPLPDLFEQSGPPLSPSKALIYTDVPAQAAAAPGPAAFESSNNHGSHGLREINANVNAGVQIPYNLGSATGGGGGLRGDAESLSSSLMGPPPLKRHGTESKLPRGGGGGKGGGPRMEGRENAMPLSASFGSSVRRLRSSPNS